MKCIAATVLFFFVYSTAVGQSLKYQPLNELGWEMANFTIPDGLTELDTGAVTFLLTINGSGDILSVQTLADTFSAGTRKLWKRSIKSATFKKADISAPTGRRVVGMVTISRDYCKTNSSDSTISPDEQVHLFNTGTKP